MLVLDSWNTFKMKLNTNNIDSKTEKSKIRKKQISKPKIRILLMYRDQGLQISASIHKHKRGWCRDIETTGCIHGIQDAFSINTNESTYTNRLTYFQMSKNIIQIREKKRERERERKRERKEKAFHQSAVSIHMHNRWITPTMSIQSKKSKISLFKIYLILKLGSFVAWYTDKF